MCLLAPAEASKEPHWRGDLGRSLLAVSTALFLSLLLVLSSWSSWRHRTDWPALLIVLDPSKTGWRMASPLGSKDLFANFLFLSGNRVRVQKGRKCTHSSSCKRQFPHVPPIVFSLFFLATHLESRNKETWMEMFRSVSIENKGFHRGLPASFVSLLEFVKGSRCCHRAPLLRLIHQQDGSFLHLPNWTVIVVEVGGGNIRFELSFASSISSTRERERRKKREGEKKTWR